MSSYRVTYYCPGVNDEFTVTVAAASEEAARELALELVNRECWAGGADRHRITSVRKSRTRKTAGE